MVAQQTLTLFVWVQILVPLPKSLGLREPRLFYEVWLSLVERYVRDVEAAGSNPVTSTTSEQSPLCSDVFFCLWHKKPPGASLPCSSSPQKVTLRLRCSLVNALTTLRLANNFLRKRTRALFFSGLQSLYKIPAGEAQRDFPALSGHRLKSRSALQRRDFPVSRGHPFPA